MASLFKDFYKPVKTLLEKEYAEDSVSFAASGKSGNNLKFKFEGKRNEDALEGSLKLEQAFPDVTFATVEVAGNLASSGDFDGELSVEEKEINVKVVVKGGLESKDLPIKEIPKEEAKVFRDNAGIDLTYSHKHFKGTAGVALRKHTPLKVNVSGAGYYEGFQVGGDVTLHPKEKEVLDNYNAGLAYKYEKTQLALLVEKKLSSAKLVVSHQFSSDVNAGLEFKYDLKKKTNELTVGTAIKLDNETKVKAKIAKDTKTTVAYFAKLNKNVEANFTVETTLSELQQGKGSSKLSFGFNYEQ